MPTLTLRGDHITLAQALKAAGLANSGGHAKHLVRDGSVKVNDGIEIHPGRKLAVGDRFQVAEAEEWIIGR